MKTERRHELQKNMLADKLAHWIEAIEPYFRTILGVVIAALVVMCVWAYLTVRDREFAEKGWDSFFQAFATQDPEKLGKTAELYSTTKVSQWARLMDADLLLAGGIDQLFTDKFDAKNQIRRAADMYRTVSGDSEAKSPLVARAKFGLARAHETLGELQLARVDYDAIVKEGGPFAEAAKQRATDLDRGETKAFYDWFAKYEPPRPSDKPEKKFDFLNESLDRGSGLKLPPAMGDGSSPPAGDAPKGDGPMNDAPKGDGPKSDAPAVQPGVPGSPEAPSGVSAPSAPGVETPAKEPAPGSPSKDSSPPGESGPTGSGAPAPAIPPATGAPAPEKK